MVKSRTASDSSHGSRASLSQNVHGLQISTSERPSSSLSNRDANRLGTPRLSKSDRGSVPVGFGSGSPSVGSQAYFGASSKSPRKSAPVGSSQQSLEVLSHSQSSVPTSPGGASRIPKYSNIVSHRTALTGSEADLFSSRGHNSRTTSPTPGSSSAQQLPQDLERELNDSEAADDFDPQGLPRPASAAGSQHTTASSTQDKPRRRSYVPVSQQNNGHHSIASSSASTSSSARSSNVAANSNKGGVFFGSGDQVAAKHKARVASAASGTGKVLSDLQFELSTVRGALETTRTTLRTTQRAVETLSRTKEELNDHVDSLRLENEGLTKMLSRRERMLAESSARAEKAESQAKEEAALADERGTKASTLEAQFDEMSESTKRNESSYEALRTSVQSAKEGWARQLQELKQAQEEMQKRHVQELQQALSTQSELQRSLDQRAESDAQLQASVDELKTAKQQLTDQFSGSTIDELTKLVHDQQAKNDASHAAAQEAISELNRIKRLMREYPSAD